MRLKEEAFVSTVTLAAGDGTLAVIFKNPFEAPPVIALGFGQTLGAGKRGFCSADSVTAKGFTITVDSDSAEGTLKVSWIAKEKSYQRE